MCFTIGLSLHKLSWMWHYVSLWRHMIKSLHTARLDRQFKSSSPGSHTQSSNCCIYRQGKSAEAISRFLAGKSEKKWEGNKSMSYILVSRRGSLAVCSLLSCRQMKIICLINVHDFSSKWSRNNDYILVSFFNQDQLIIDYCAGCNTLFMKYADWLCGAGINSRKEPIILTPCNVLLPWEQC